MSVLFFHGVPDTPAVWQPLIEALGLSDADYRAPALPGFGRALPAGFTPSKEAYLDWMITQIGAAASAAGEPVHIVAHDWGALLASRAISLRPELVKSWALSGAVPDPDYKWHVTARRWQTPLVGELMMKLTTPDRLASALTKAGLPEDIAAHETSVWDKRMRQCILALYRSARNVASEWSATAEDLPPHGQLIWGANDPFVSVSIADAFAGRCGLPLHVEPATGHWAIAEAPQSVAAILSALWEAADAAAPSPDGKDGDETPA